MPEHIVFLTGKLAERNLRGVLEDLTADEFTCEVVRLPINVAGLMTADFISRHFPPGASADRVIVPGRCRAIWRRSAPGSAFGSNGALTSCAICRSTSAVGARAWICPGTTC